MTMARRDVIIVGGGAAGLATAIFTARRSSGTSVAVLDGARKLGAKILVSGGGRCNVTHAAVRPSDFWGGSSNTVRRVLSAFPVEPTIAFFEEIGVSLHEEPEGKLFPNSHSARTVINALLAEAQRLRVEILAEHRVLDVERTEAGYNLHTPKGPYTARQVVLATGGLSLPKTGSDGTGYRLAQHLGHSIVPTTPALAPLLLDGNFHSALTGVAQDVEVMVQTGGPVPAAPAGDKPIRLSGALLWTHFGVSGPVVLDASRHWHRARLQGRDVRVTVNLLPGESFESAEAALLSAAAQKPKASLRHALAERLPARVADAVLDHLGIDRQIPLAHLARDLRRRLLHALLAWPLPVRDSRGYNYAEVTAGGVPLDEIDPSTMQSRKSPGLYLVGEILDVDGRIGGFNFQWAWSSAYVAARALMRRATPA
ncbi:MAG: flavoprotein [Phycisphaerae bacterium]